MKGYKCSECGYSVSAEAMSGDMKKKGIAYCPSCGEKTEMKMSNSMEGVVERLLSGEEFRNIYLEGNKLPETTKE
jgi:DNA-directed RNA polymerase subunit RPC12/RpoP